MQRFIIFSFFLTLPFGCANLHTGRSYLSEMERDDSHFFEPRTDFPVVAGDTGRFWNTDKEQDARTPKSFEDIQESRTSRFLREELRDLEATQSEDNLKFYDKHKHHFPNVSEKIYFLSLHPSERREYLSMRGFLSSSRRSDLDRSPAATESLKGLKKSDVVSSLGKPALVEVAGNPRNENERWLYHVNGASKYIYFEGGEVQGWE